MARNGSGTYTLPSGNPVVTGTTISSTWANNTFNDVATTLTASLAYDGQTTPVANLPMGGYIHTGVGNATARTQYPSSGQVQDGALTYLSSISGTNTITATGPLSMSAYVAGQKFTFIASGANTGAVTININGIGTKSVTKNGANPLVLGDIVSSAIIDVVYDGTQFQMLSPTPAVTSVSGGYTGLVTYNSNPTTVTISFASPSIFTVASASLLPANNTQIELFTSGTLPTGLITNQIYYVVNASGTTFNVSLTSGGVAINTTGAGSGTHSFAALTNVGAVSLAGTLGTGYGGTGSTSTAYCNLSTNVNNTLPAANGGTGLNTIPTGNLLVGNANSTITTLAPSNNGQKVIITAGATITAGAFVVGATYTILVVGTTDFTLIGAASNTVGVSFTATGVGTGTGTATLNTFSTGSSISSATSVASTSGTSINFTNIPSWAKRITLMFNGVSTTGSSNINIQLGTSGTPETTGYSGTSGKYSNGNTTSVSVVDSTGFSTDAAAGDVMYGTWVFTNITSNTWICSATVNRSGTIMFVVTGSKSLAGVLNMLRVTTASGTPTFDAGSINILYE